MGTKLSDWPKSVQKQIRDKDRNVVSARNVSQSIWINKLPPGLNGPDGLLNLHWTDYNKLKKRWVDYVFAKQPKKHYGKVNLTYTRKSINMMDWDNLSASFKVVGDALEANNIIIDDSPRIIKKFTPLWEKADRMRAQGVLIEIEDVE